MAPEAIDRLFRGLDRIEETRGLYRPISLNMIGLVLERMGHTLEGDPETLIQAYLRSALLTGDTKDYVRALLEQMISDAGTKIPRSRAELGARTGLADWKVAAALADLESRGLVRRLHGVEQGWEIAHDFLARLLGQMLGRITMPPWTRARPYVAPAGLAFWMAMFGFSVQYGIVQYQVHVKNELKRSGWTIEALEEGKFRLSLYCVDDLKVSSFEYLKRLDGLASLTIDCDKLTDLGLIRELKLLKRLSLGSISRVVSLEPLRELKSLTDLSLHDAKRVTNLGPLRDLESLIELSLKDVARVKSLEPLRELKSLTRLDLRGATGVTSLEPLRDLKSLTSLDLSGVTGVTSLEPLRDLKSLSRLNLGGATGVTSLEPLRDLKSLARLDLSETTGVVGLEPLKGHEIVIIGASDKLRGTMH